MTLKDLSKSGKTFWRFSQSEPGKSQESPFAEYQPGHITIGENEGPLSFVSDETIVNCFMYGDMLTELNFDVRDVKFQEIMDCQVDPIGNSLGEYQCNKLLTKANYSLSDPKTIYLFFSMVRETAQLAEIFGFENHNGRFPDFLWDFGFTESALLLDYLMDTFNKDIHLSPEEILHIIHNYLRVHI